MPKFSANLGFLWNNLPLPEAIHAAKAAGFDAVECHSPYETPAEQVAQALHETAMEMVCINTRHGKIDSGELGLAAMTGRESDARQQIDEAIEYAVKTGCKNIHVLAGMSDAGDVAEITYRDNLQYACMEARKNGITVLIEPMNRLDMPDYHLSRLEQALVTLRAVDRYNLKIMFDCYHMQIMGGNLLHRLKQNIDMIGHIQFSGVPNRCEPNTGEINFGWLVENMDRIGWQGYLGAEYKPHTSTEKSLSWLKAHSG